MAPDIQLSCYINTIKREKTEHGVKFELVISCTWPHKYGGKVEFLFKWTILPLKLVMCKAHGIILLDLTA